MNTLIRHVHAGDADLAHLVAGLDRELNERYPADEVFGLDFDDPSIGEVVFVVAYEEDMPVGCGAFKPLDGERAELKRFYVRPELRGRGIAGAMLRELERRAAEAGFCRLLLETGDRQPEALGLYRKHGYAEIPRYGEYADCESSVCFAKTIGN